MFETAKREQILWTIISINLGVTTFGTGFVIVDVVVIVVVVLEEEEEEEEEDDDDEEIKLKPDC